MEDRLRNRVLAVVYVAALAVFGFAATVRAEWWACCEDASSECPGSGTLCVDGPSDCYCNLFYCEEMYCVT